jgi:RND family efflux transporter MFP subunit
MHTKTNPSPGTGRMLKRFALSVALILAIGFIIVFALKWAHEEHLDRTTKTETSVEPVVSIITVQKAPESSSLTLPGQTAAWYESIIYARVDGYVGSWNADIGDHVKKDQVLATIDTPDLDAQLAAAKAKLRAAEAQVEFTKSTYERWKNSPTGVVSEQEREAKKADYDSAVAEMGLDQADVNRYMALTQFKQVTAPYDGTITERHIDIGNLVTSGSTANTTSLYRIVQDDPIRVFVDVPQSAAENIKDGLAVHVTANNLPGKIFEGKVTRTADAINEQTRTLHVEVDIPNPDHVLVSGMYVDTAFEVPNQGMLEVPAAALVFRPGGPQIAVIDKDNKVDFHNVVIARDNGNTVEIASGVAAGDKVVLNIGAQITQGQTVKTGDDANRDDDSNADNTDDNDNDAQK